MNGAFKNAITCCQKLNALTLIKMVLNCGCRQKQPSPLSSFHCVSLTINQRYRETYLFSFIAFHLIIATNCYLTVCLFYSFDYFFVQSCRKSSQRNCYYLVSLNSLPYWVTSFWGYFRITVFVFFYSVVEWNIVIMCWLSACKLVLRLTKKVLN